MTVENRTPYVVVALLFVMGLCLAGSLFGAMGQFTPQDWAEMAGMQAQIPERVRHLEELNRVEEKTAAEVQESEAARAQAWNESLERVYRAGGLALVLLAAVWGGNRAWRVFYQEREAERERRSAANLREVQDRKGQGNPAFTPAGFLTRTTVIEGETFVASDLTGEMIPVRDGERMRGFRDAHVAAMMAAMMAKRDVLIARAGRRDQPDEVILIGDGL